ncbi:retrovirus-related pol polyprotein from transposon TNT 1-94 [Tanacetum coccineum]
MICKPKSFYDEKNKVVIGYKNPLCLTRAKQVQPALYNGHILVMANHARLVVHDLEDTREISEITRKRMLEKMKSPLCVENKIKIRPPDYSKENLLATFAPHRNLTPEQIFWARDENDRKKAETAVPKPLRGNDSVSSQYSCQACSVRRQLKLPLEVSVKQKFLLLVVQVIFGNLDSGCSKHMMRRIISKLKISRKFHQGQSDFGMITSESLSWDMEIMLMEKLELPSESILAFDVIIMVQLNLKVGLNKTVRYIRTDNGTEFVNQVMSKYYEGVGIFHQKSVPRTPQQNGVVERQNRTLVEAARTMLIFSKAPMFLWAEAVATASMATNDSEDLGKFQAKADIRIFVGYAPSRKGYRIYNKRTRRLMETIHVTFDEMHQTMAPVRISSGPEPIMMTPGQLNSGLAPSPVPATTYIPPQIYDLENLFQPDVR